jgi:tetratricopeptide (TPR) repeat protein
MYVQACEATHVRGEQSAEVLDLRMSCLQGRLDSIKALTDVFTRADAEVVEKAPSAAQALGSLDRCNDLALLRAVVKPPDDPAVRASVQALKSRLAEVKALTDAGHITEALARARPAVEEARRAGYLPVVAEALRRLGWISLGNPAQAEAMLEEAAWAAQAGGDEELFAEAATLQVYVVGYLEGQTARARPWSKVADATLRRLGGHDVLRSWLLTHDASTFEIDGHYDEAVRALKESVTLKEKSLSPDDPDVAQSLGNLADVLAKQGKPDEALRLNGRAVQILEKRLGGDHPDLAMNLSSRGEYLNALGRYSEAEQPAGRALEIWERTFGREHAFVAFALTALGRSCLGQERAADAVGYLELAYRIRARVDPEPSRLGETAFALAQALWQSRQDRRRAVDLAGTAQTLYAKTPEKRNLETVDVWLRQYGRTVL